MNSGKTVFSQLMDFLPSYEFRLCVDRYHGNYKVKSFSCWDQFLSMAFAQLTYRESLRDIETCLRAAGEKLYHMGIRGKVSRNTLAHANEVRDWRIYHDFAQALIQNARELYLGDPLQVQLDQTAYALDSTIVDLCLTLFPWAKFRKRKAAVKLHTLLDLRASIPTTVIVTTGAVHDVNIMDELFWEPGSIYVMDRGYVDFARLYRSANSNDLSGRMVCLRKLRRKKMATSKERDMEKGKGHLAMKTPPVVSPQEWEAARQQLLVKEKALTRSRDALAAERRRMPWQAVEKNYEFDGPKGKVSLLDLFEGRRQLIVYRAFFEPGVFGWPEHACRGCSFVRSGRPPGPSERARHYSRVRVTRAARGHRAPEGTNGLDDAVVHHHG